jgi:hypothetical protein
MITAWLSVQYGVFTPGRCGSRFTVSFPFQLLYVCSICLSVVAAADAIFDEAAESGHSEQQPKRHVNWYVPPDQFNTLSTFEDSAAGKILDNHFAHE